MRFDIENNLRPIAQSAAVGVGATGLSLCAVTPAASACFGVGHAIAAGPPVDAATLFGIGSLTKAQTALACMAAGLDPDAPLAPMLPGWDGVGTARFGDLLSGRTGRRHAEEIPLRAVFSDTVPYLQAAMRLPVDAAAGQRFRYSNAMFTLAAHLLAAQSGAESWDAALAARVWTPLGMTDTRPFSGATPDAPAAMPHLNDSGALRPAGWGFFGREMEGGAGAVLSSARDMLRLLRLFACPGPDAPAALVRAAQSALRPRIDAPDENPLAAIAARVAAGVGPDAAAYGLGWFLHQWRGQRLATHSGGFGGFSAYIAVQPDSGRGVAMFANARAPRAILEGACLLALDRIAGIDGPDWLDVARKLPARADYFALPSGVARAPASAAGALPPEGRYATEVLGPILRVAHTGDTATLFCGRLRGILQPLVGGGYHLIAPGVLERPLQDILSFPGLEGQAAGAEPTRFAMVRGIQRVYFL